MREERLEEPRREDRPGGPPALLADAIPLIPPPAPPPLSPPPKDDEFILAPPLVLANKPGKLGPLFETRLVDPPALEEEEVGIVLAPPPGRVLCSYTPLEVVVGVEGFKEGVKVDDGC